MNDAALRSIVSAWPPPGGPRSIVVTGAAGSGKSRLVAEALTRLSPAPRITLMGHARTHPAPYDWTAAALRDHAETLPVPAGAAAWLLRTHGQPPHRLEPTALLRAAGEAVSFLVGEGPGVIVAEDVHALDPASLTLLGELATRDELRVLLVIVTRPSDVAGYPKPASRLLKRLEEHDAARVELEPGTATPDCDVDAEVTFARYARATGDEPGAAAASMRAAAELLRTGNPEEARRVIDAGGGEPDVEDDESLATHLVLARALLRLGRVESAARVSHPWLDGDDPATRRLRAEVTALAEITAREREVLRCLAAGMSNREVARHLDISVRTVTVHVSNLLRKTGTASRTEAALWAVRHGLR